MVRRVVVSVILLLGGLVLVTPGSAGVERQPDPPVKRAVRAYGDGPVTVVKDQVLRLRFKGREGDRVRLADVYRSKRYGTYYGYASSVRLLTASGRRVAKDPTDFFRLPRSGWFTFRHKGVYAKRTGSQVQLMLQHRRVHQPGRPLRIPERRGHQYAVWLRAPQTGFRLTTFGTYVEGALTRRRYGSGGEGQAVLLGPGYGVLHGDPDYPLTESLEPDQRVLVVLSPDHGGTTVSSVPTPLTVSVDAPDLTLPAGSSTGVDLSFAGRADQLVRVAALEPEPWDAWRLVVLGPGGRRLRPAAPAAGLDGQLFPLPVDGTYRVLAIPSVPADTPTRLTVRSVVEAPPIEIDGPGVTVAPPADGRWFVAPIIGEAVDDQTDAYLVSGPITLPGDWRVYAGLLRGPRCRAGGPLSCGEGVGTSVWPEVAWNGPIVFGGYVVVMPADGGATGSIDLRLTTEPPG